MEGHSSRPEQEKDRISELEYKMEIKGKTEELLDKQLKTCENNIQELTHFIKRPNLKIMGIEEVEEGQAKRIHNIFNKIITNNFPNLENAMPIQVQEASRIQNRLDQNRTTPQCIIIKTTSKENKERTMKLVREKKQITYKGKPIKTTADFSTKTLKARRAWSEVFWTLNENSFNPRILYPAKLSFKIEGEIKVFHDKQKLKQYMTTEPTLKRFFKEFCTQIMKENKTVRGQAASNHRRRKDKESEGNIYSVAHNQTLKQQKQLSDRNHQIPISINTEC
jgi:hypothetical protein